MKRHPKTPKLPGFMRSVLAHNVEELMHRHFSMSSNKPKALAAQAKVSLSTVQRIIAAEVGASLDNIEAIASVFEVSTYQLLVPNLNIENPQVIKGATKDEERLYDVWRRGKGLGPTPTAGTPDSSPLKPSGTKIKMPQKQPVS